MKTETTYLWRIKWAGRWTTTKYHCTEEQIRKEHPEAVCLVASKRELQVPESEKELREVQQMNFTSGFLANQRR
jgi:hypothetical protein